MPWVDGGTDSASISSFGGGSKWDCFLLRETSAFLVALKRLNGTNENSDHILWYHLGDVLLIGPSSAISSSTAVPKKSPSLSRRSEGVE